jgi:hypothetical protein
MEEQLRQERSARQQVETRLQQERSALEEAQAALERECMAREEAQGQLQRERATLEKAQVTLKFRDEEVTRLNGELAQLSVSYEDQCQAGEEKDATVLDLQQGAEATRAALETERKQVEGELPFPPFTRCLDCFESAPNLIYALVFRPTDDSRELSDPGAGHLDGLQLFLAGAGGVAGRRPRGVPRD